MRPKLLRFLLVVGLAGSVVPVTAADAVQLLGPTVETGGPGGGAFRDDCRRGQVLVGVNVTVGDDMNSISPVCGAMQNGTVIDDLRHQGTWGQARDKSGRASCYPNVIQGMYVGVSHVNLVHHLELICREITTARVYGKRLVNAYGGGYLIHSGESQRTERIDCGGGAFAVGIFGGYGSFVDRIGLICGRIEQAAAPQQPNTPPSQQTQPSRAGPLPVGGGNTGGGGGGANGRANSEVTAYAEKFGEGAEVYFLEAGEAVTIIQCGNPEDWCEISAPVYGWVYAPQLDR